MLRSSLVLLHRARVLGFAALFAVGLPSLVCARQTLLAGERPTAVTAIPDVVAAGAAWEIVWADFETADGLVASPDGGLLFAQEQTDTVRKLDVNGKEFVVATNTHGSGALSVDAQGRLFAVFRTCTDPGRPFSAACQELTSISQLMPEPRTVATGFADGRWLGRLNDLAADGRGGAYFTVGGAFHAAGDGRVTPVAEDIRANGITLSRDGRTLFVTNATEVLAFTVAGDGTTSGRRVFATLAGDQGADGMTTDAAGRLYVTASRGVHVFAADGRSLGLIPTPRTPISLAFTGPERRMLYVSMLGAVGPDGKPWSTPQGVRNTAMSIYRIPTIATGPTIGVR